MLGIILDLSIYSYPFAQKKKLFPAKSQTLLHQFLSDEVKVWNLEPQGPVTFLLDLSTPGIQRFRSETAAHSRCERTVSSSALYKLQTQRLHSRKEPAVLPMTGNAQPLLFLFNFPFVHLSALASLHKEDEDIVWPSIWWQALRWALSHSLSHYDPRQTSHYLHLLLKLHGPVTLSTEGWREVLQQSLTLSRPSTPSCFYYSCNSLLWTLSCLANLEQVQNNNKKFVYSISIVQIILALCIRIILPLSKPTFTRHCREWLQSLRSIDQLRFIFRERSCVLPGAALQKHRLHPDSAVGFGFHQTRMESVLALPTLTKGLCSAAWLDAVLVKLSDNYRVKGCVHNVYPIHTEEK